MILAKKPRFRLANSIVLLMALVNPIASSSMHDYRRAQSLASSDPLEAEALYERFVANAEGGKMRRSANYELFFLRLKHARLVEAFLQINHKFLAEKYHQAIADRFAVSRKKVTVLIRKLRAVCDRQKNVAAIGDYLRENSFSAPLWDFSLRILSHCEVKNRSSIFSEELFEKQNASRSEILLRLIAIREQLYKDAEKAEQLLLFTRQDAAERYSGDIALAVQFSVLEARIADERGEYERVIQICDDLVSTETPSQAIAACNLLAAHALLRLGHAEQALQRITKTKLERANLDGRLLYLLIALEVGKRESHELRQFTKRASYRYCARKLRDLAAQILARTDT